MERSQLWSKSFSMNPQLLEMNLVGLTDEQAAKAPAPGVSSPAWTLGQFGVFRKLLGLGGAI